MKMLYVSCHSILEYDEIKLFTELGIDVFSYGAYRDPRTLDDKKRPLLKHPVHEDFIELTKKDDKEHIPIEIINWADVIVFMHRTDWMWANWNNLRGKNVVLRTIGQNNWERENEIRPLKRDGLKIVRYSPREKTIPGWVGEDAMIRFYKDPEEYGNWAGTTEGVLTISQSMKQREGDCNYQFFKDATEGYPRALLGPGNVDSPEMWKGCVEYEEMKQYLRDYRVYFYTGTYPASYTLNFIEALMTGIPVIALGPVWGNSPSEPGQQTYEVSDWTDDGKNVLIADSVESARNSIKNLMHGVLYAQEISERGRALALQLFAKDRIMEQWRRFLMNNK